MVHHLYREQQLSCNIRTAWDFFSSAQNLSKITPKEMGFTVLTELADPDIYQGMLIDYRVKPILGIPMRWQTEITEVDFPHSFVDFQRKGPYKLWRHHHWFVANAEGVLMTDRVDYELPFAG